MRSWKNYQMIRDITVELVLTLSISFIMALLIYISMVNEQLI
jgi:hypothetical protein